MISNLDFERKKHPHNNNIVNKRIYEINKCEAEILKSKKFNRFMERLLKAYARGEINCHLPLFFPKTFPYHIISKFNSYDLNCTLVYDFLNNSMLFKPRLRL